MKFPLYFILIVFGIYTCSQKPDLPKKSIPDQGVKIDFATGFKENFKLYGEENSKLLDTFYRINSWIPIWLDDSLQLNKDGVQFIQILNHANYYGLDPNKYSTEEIQKMERSLKKSVAPDDKLKHAVALEKFLTEKYFVFGKHLNYGVVDSIENLTTIPRKRFTIDLPDYLYNAYQQDSVVSYLLKLQPDHYYYRKLQKGLVDFFKKEALSTEKIRVENYKKDSLQSYVQAKKALENHGYITKNSGDTAFIRGLKRFQYDHGLIADGVIGKNTASALSESPFEYYQQAVVSLERWRWKPEWEKDYIYVNIPAFKLYLHLGDTIREKHNVVVGNYKNKSPEVYSELGYLVAYPFWHVPRSISLKEILVNARMDSTYFTRNNYEIFSKEMNSIPADNIDWDTIDNKNFNYYIRQRGGPSNSLGLVKFIFENKYSIYLHDTPTKYHFFRDIRAYSHGCIRVQNAIKVADNILKFDKNEYTIDSVYKYVERKNEKKMTLHKKIPVYIQYITCEADENNNIIFYRDIYNKDKEVFTSMYQR